MSSYGTKGEKSVVDFTDVKSNASLCSRLWSLSMSALNHQECGHPLYATDLVIGLLGHCILMLNG